MKKYMVACAGLCVALAFTSCKSSESAYKKAYERAKAQEQTTTEPETTTPTVTPVTQQPVTQATVVDNADNAVVRRENYAVVSGPAINGFGVVVGSFSLKANAEGLQSTLQSAGYTPSIVLNSERGMYRVVATSFASKSDAVRSRNDLRSKYPDAWLLFKK
uniref:SPOR domain-containing protein n=5 Tax=unclassified Prevotella TaxID=2638335 RepID=A0AB33JSB7_9BACT